MKWIKGLTMNIYKDHRHEVDKRPYTENLQGPGHEVDKGLTLSIYKDQRHEVDKRPYTEHLQGKGTRS